MARKTARGKAAGNKVRLDLSDVEGRVVLPEDDYIVEVDSVTVEKGPAADYLKWKFAVVGGDYAGKPLYYNTSLATQSLWSLRSMLESMGVEIPDSAFDLDLEEMKGHKLAVNVEHDTYDGKKQSKVVDFWAADVSDEPEGDEDEDEAPAPAKKGKKAAVTGDDEDEAPAPAKKGKKAKKPAITEDMVNEMSQEELEEVIEEHELDLDLSEYRTLRKMRAAVIDELKEAEIID